MDLLYLRRNISLRGCTVLGGAGYDFVAGHLVDLLFETTHLIVRPERGQSAEIQYVELAEITISGPGAVTRGGGFVGGGFGAEGAVEGIAVASILNALTTRTKIHTFVSLLTHHGEIHLHYDGMEPGALRVALAEVFACLRRLDPKWVRSCLERLEMQQAANVLTEEQLQILRRRVKEHPQKPPESPKAPEGPLGTCPNCDATIPLRSEECPRCTANFGVHSAWRVLPI